MTARANLRPFPPGEYPLVIVGSGPGGIQLSSALRRHGVDHAVIAASDGPGGMFRSYPIFDRLISWTKPYAPAERSSEAYGRYDWNSLLSDDPACRYLMTEFMDGTSYFPSRREMQAGLTAFVERTGLAIRHGCTWGSTRIDGDRFVIGTSDGEYRCRIAVFAMGMTAPWKPDIAGLDAVPHYVDTQPADTYADQRVVIIGKRNSACEIADGLLPYAKQIVLASPSPMRISVVTPHVAAARARYMQPYEDYVFGGGNLVLDVAIDRVVRTPTGWSVHAQGTTVPGALTLDCDAVIAATGFTTPLGDLPDLGVAAVGPNNLPAQTPYWESSTVQNVYFAGSATLGSAGLRRYGISSSSGSVRGMRQNALVLGEHIAVKHFGAVPRREPVPPDEAAGFLLRCADVDPALWNQPAYLARVMTFGSGPTDEGVKPLADFVDSGGADGIAMTVETDPEGDIHPVAFVRSRGEVREARLASDATMGFDSADNLALLTSLVEPLLAGSRPGVR